MTLHAAVWHHDGLRFHTVTIEATERGMAGARVDARGDATCLDGQDAAAILRGLNHPVGNTTMRTSRLGGNLGDLQAIAEAVQSYRFTFSREAQLQEGVAAVLGTLDYPVHREVRLSEADRIDFLVGGVGVEVKTSGALFTVLHQLQRYAHHDQISGLVLVTTCARHRTLPASIGDKALEVAYIGAAW